MYLGGGPAAEPRHEASPWIFRQFCCAEPWELLDGVLNKSFGDLLLGVRES